MAMQLHSGVGNRMGRNPARRRQRRKGLMSEINVTPFVDVMLVLLIIFMVTAPLMTAGVVVDLPEADSEVLPGKDEPLNVGVTREGEVYINKLKVPLPELAAKLEAITDAKKKKETRIFISGDKAVNYGQMITVMSVINKAGFYKVSLVTEQVK